MGLILKRMVGFKIGEKKNLIKKKMEWKEFWLTELE